MKQAIHLFLVLLLISAGFYSKAGSKFITSNGYENCIEISNGICRVVLEPNCGGRVLVYEIDGKNALYIDPRQDGYIPAPDEWYKTPGMDPCAGRFGIGPEKLNPDTKLFWLGKWSAEITGNFSARMTSQVDEKENLQLVRDFQLDPKTSKFKVTQTIKNLGDAPRKLCYWSRTFATGGGICIVPLSTPNRFPKGYISYGDGSVLQYLPPAEENIQVRDDCFLLVGPTKATKYVFDTDKGWLAYITKNNLLFVKRYDYQKSAEYGEMTASPLSIWYKNETMAELEPIGPWEWIKPKGKSSFSETWDLLLFSYPQNKVVDIETIKAKVKALN